MLRSIYTLAAQVRTPGSDLSQALYVALSARQISLQQGSTTLARHSAKLICSNRVSDTNQGLARGQPPCMRHAQVKPRVNQSETPVSLAKCSVGIHIVSCHSKYIHHGTTAANAPMFASSESELFSFSDCPDMVWQRRAGSQRPHSWNN